MPTIITDFFEYLMVSVLPPAAIAALALYYWNRNRRPIVINTPAVVNMHPYMTIINQTMFLQKAEEYRAGRETIMCRYVNDTFFDSFKDTLSHFLTTVMLTGLLDFKNKESSEDYCRLATLISFYLQRPIPKEMVIIDERTMQYFWGFEHGHEVVKVDLTDESQYHPKGLCSSDLLSSVFKDAIRIISRVEDSITKYGPLPFEFLMIETAILSTHESRSAIRSLLTVYYGTFNRSMPRDWMVLNEDTRHLRTLFEQQRNEIRSKMQPGIFTSHEAEVTETKPTHLRVVK